MAACWDCFYCSPVVGKIGAFKCNKTSRRVKGEHSCSNFVDENTPGIHSCFECEHFGYYKFGSIFEKENYCDRKKKVVNPDGLACGEFVE